MCFLYLVVERGHLVDGRPHRVIHLKQYDLFFQAVQMQLKIQAVIPSSLPDTVTENKLCGGSLTQYATEYSSQYRKLREADNVSRQHSSTLHQQLSRRIRFIVIADFSDLHLKAISNSPEKPLKPQELSEDSAKTEP